jgi:hypothetical protein
MLTAILEETRSFKKVFSKSHLPELLEEKSTSLRELKLKLDLEFQDATREALLCDMRCVRERASMIDRIQVELAERTRLQVLDSLYKLLISNPAFPNRNISSSMPEETPRQGKPQSPKVGIKLIYSSHETALRECEPSATYVISTYSR